MGAIISQNAGLQGEGKSEPHTKMRSCSLHEVQNKQNKLVCACQNCTAELNVYSNAGVRRVGGVRASYKDES